MTNNFLINLIGFILVLIPFYLLLEVFGDDAFLCIAITVLYIVLIPFIYCFISDRYNKK